MVIQIENAVFVSPRTGFHFNCRIGIHHYLAVHGVFEHCSDTSVLTRRSGRYVPDAWWAGSSLILSSAMAAKFSKYPVSLLPVAFSRIVDYPLPVIGDIADQHTDEVNRKAVEEFNALPDSPQLRSTLGDYRYLLPHSHGIECESAADAEEVRVCCGKYSGVPDWSGKISYSVLKANGVMRIDDSHIVMLHSLYVQLFEALPPEYFSLKFYLFENDDTT